MPPTDPTSTPPNSPPEGPKPEGRWQIIANKASARGRVAGLLAAVLLAGGGVGYLLSQNTGTKPQPTKPGSTVKVESLSDEEIRKLSQIGTSLGNSDQTLTIGANSVFQGKVDIASDLTLGGRLNANGPVSFPALSIAGQTNLSDLAIQQNLQVNGQANVARGLTVQNLLAVNGNLTVSGAASFGSITTGSVSARQIQITGPFIISHITSQGPPVTATAGTAVGSGGTVSVSGNDTAGTVNANVGSNTAGGILVNVNFRSAYGSTVRVLLTPLTAAAASTPVYVTRTATGFTIRTNTAAPSSSNLSYDYFVIQ